MKPSPQRVLPPCKHFEKCGGCVWQHIEYSTQIETKQRLFQNFLKDFSAIEFLSPQASEKTYNYRNRIQLQKKNDLIGYYQRSSQKLVNIDTCLIAEEDINNYISQIKLLKDGRYEIYKDLNNKVRHRLQNEKSEALTFSQVNSLQNNKLVETALDWVQVAQPQSLLELFCGSGNFTFSLAKKMKNTQITAIDGSPKLVKMAQGQPANNNIQFLQADLKGNCLSQNLKNKCFDLILLDPPRVGCSEKLLEDIVDLKPKSLLYISCNPATLKRDLQYLEKKSYIPIKSQLFDMFPQTDHIESMTFVTRLSNKS